MSLDDLRELAERLPPGAGIVLPREVILELVGAPREAPTPELDVDLTVAGVAEKLGRRPSTVRAWCERGELPGAYKLRGREWRIPRSALEAFLDSQRLGKGQSDRLGDWRRVAKPSGWRV